MERERGKIDASARQCSEWKRRNEGLSAGQRAREGERCLGVPGCWCLGAGVLGLWETREEWLLTARVSLGDREQFPRPGNYHMALHHTQKKAS